jgi:hypothetical protein
MDSYYNDMTETEQKVAEYLNELKLYWVYQSPIFIYDTEKRPRVWTPDFYLPNLGMHIEVWNSQSKGHEYRDRVYKKNGYRVIFVHVYEQEERWKKYLIRSITAIESKRHEQVMLLSSKMP